jgi:hypothetical protein
MNNITNQKEYQKYPRKKKQQQHNKYKVKKKTHKWICTQTLPRTTTTHAPNLPIKGRNNYRRKSGTQAGHQSTTRTQLNNPTL